MKYTYKNILKILINEYHRTQDKFIKIEKLFPSSKENKDVFESFSSLSAKGLTNNVFDSIGKLYRVTLTDKALTFFNDRKKEIIRFWVPIIISNMLSVAALIVAILAYLKQ